MTEHKHGQDEKTEECLGLVKESGKTGDGAMNEKPGVLVTRSRRKGQ